jgi:hypothetical protein
MYNREKNPNLAEIFGVEETEEITKKAEETEAPKLWQTKMPEIEEKTEEFEKPIQTETKEISSAQILFPNRKTAEEVVKELWDAYDELNTKFENIKKEMST